ncbi:hypothetical protein [Amycolatopsis minnesotensis]|uniref:hypothetical protein n=1 Tax=Amycolatopsis minnesotensis TaxID=337894 RepID=UPI0031D21E80
MRYTAKLAGAGLVLIAGAACASPEAASPPPASGPVASQPGTTIPEQPPVQKPSPKPGAQPPPSKVGKPVPPQQLDANALPAGFPRDVAVGPDGKTVIVRAEEGGCGHATVEPKEQTPQRVVLNLVETTAQTHKMCTMDIRYPVVSTQLADQLGDRKLVLTSEHRKQ